MNGVRTKERAFMMKSKISFAATVVLCWSVALTGAAVHASAEPEPQESTGVALTPGEYEQITSASLKAYGNPLTITAADFRSDGVNPEELIHAMPDDALRGNDSESAFAVAPVYLPDDATIASAGVILYDGYGGTSGPCGDVWGRDVWAYLLRVNNTTGVQQQMTYFSTAGMDPDRQYFLDTEVGFPDIQYPQYSYYAVAKVCSSAHLFYAMQIFFSLP